MITGNGIFYRGIWKNGENYIRLGNIRKSLSTLIIADIIYFFSGLLYLFPIFISRITWLKRGGKGGTCIFPALCSYKK